MKRLARFVLREVEAAATEVDALRGVRPQHRRVSAEAAAAGVLSTPDRVHDTPVHPRQPLPKRAAYRGTAGR